MLVKLYGRLASVLTGNKAAVATDAIKASGLKLPVKYFKIKKQSPSKLLMGIAFNEVK